MKKLFFISALILIAGINYGQAFPKGAILGLHEGSPVTLNHGYTMDQYLTFLKEKYVPEFEKNWPGIKLYFLLGKRGQSENNLGVLYVLESDAVRNKYWSAEGQLSEVGMAANAKMKALDEENNKYVKPSDAQDKYTDWVIQ